MLSILTALRRRYVTERSAIPQRQSFDETVDCLAREQKFNEVARFAIPNNRY